MTPDVRYILSILGIVIGFVGYYPYFRDVYLGKTKPHAFSWLIWGILTGIGFLIQIFEKGGLGSWVLGTTSIISFILAIIGFYQKQTVYHFYDWISLLGAAIAFLLWYFTNDPFYSILIISFIDLIGFLPTYRKIYYKPNSETLITWYIMNIRIIIGIFALSTYSFNTIFYPLSIFVFNSSVIILVHWRRNKLSNNIKL